MLSTHYQYAIPKIQLSTSSPRPLAWPLTSLNARDSVQFGKRNDGPEPKTPETIQELLDAAGTEQLFQQSTSRHRACNLPPFKIHKVEKTQGFLAVAILTEHLPEGLTQDDVTNYSVDVYCQKPDGNFDNVYANAVVTADKKNGRIIVGL